MKNKKNKTAIQTFSKVWVNRIMWVAILDVQLSYILAFFDKQIAETLSIAVITEIIGVMLAYFGKSYFETKEEKKNEIDLYKFEKYVKSNEESDEEDAKG